MDAPKLIYCAGGNRRFAEIAINAGYLYGARLPRDKPHFPIYFADQDWKNPARERYMMELRRHRPKMATVLDLQDVSKFREVLSWAEEASQFCEMVVIIPKADGIIKRLPRRINRKEIILGFSVPTGYGRTTLLKEEFKGYMVHLLGGSPHVQMRVWERMSYYAEIVSIDGNYTQRMAVRHNRFWTKGDAHYARNRWFPRLDEADGRKWIGDAPYEAFKRSCVNVKREWMELVKIAKTNYYKK